MTATAACSRRTQTHRTFGGLMVLAMSAAAFSAAMPDSAQGQGQGQKKGQSQRASRAEGAALPKLKTEIAFPNLKFHRPVAMTTLGAGENERVFVIEQPGVIVSFPNRSDAKEQGRVQVLDIKAKVNSRGNEEGLLGLAFHPKFAENGQLFVYYSAINPGPRRSVVSRFSTSGKPPVADPQSEVVIWESATDPFENHNGGCIEFGPDGHLYISLGDSGAADDPLMSGQNPKDWWGSILRLDVDHPAEGKNYGIPKDNPAVRSKAHAHWAPEVYCIGLRNVWKFTFDREAPHPLWAGDVGQNLFEIVHLIENGGNYGWSVREGNHPFAPKARQRRDPAVPISPAIADYPHSLGQSITGGYVYRGKALPDLVGVYVYGDFNTGRIWGLRWEKGKLLGNSELIDIRAQGAQQISAFGQDAAGEMYVLSFDGRIRKFAPRNP